VEVHGCGAAVALTGAVIPPEDASELRRFLVSAVRHYGGAVNIPRFRYELVSHNLTTTELARLAGVSRWSISRALNGHRINSRTLEKIAKALSEAPVVDRGLAALPTQLEEN
jgi:DNA-binding Xre family transcriptional regulator